MHPKKVHSPFLLSGIAYCGKALVGKYAKSGQFSYYVCGTLDKKGSGACRAKYTSTEKFENLVIEQINRRILTRDNLINLIRMVNEEMDSTVNSCQDELNIISDATADVNHRLERLYDAIETGKLNLDDLVVRIRELRSRQDQLQARRIVIESQMSDRKVELTDLENITGYVDDLHELLKDSLKWEISYELLEKSGGKSDFSTKFPRIPRKQALKDEVICRLFQFQIRLQPYEKLQWYRCRNSVLKRVNRDFTGFPPGCLEGIK